MELSSSAVQCKGLARKGQVPRSISAIRTARSWNLLAKVLPLRPSRVKNEKNETVMTEAPGTHNPEFLPTDIPAPQDDGGARHLTGAKLPDIELPTTDGTAINLSKLKGRTVVYVYPRTGV